MVLRSGGRVELIGPAEPRVGRAVAGLQTRLHEHGLRCTDQRRAVVTLLAVQDGPGHLSAVEVRDRLQVSGARIDLSTVYRTLALLTEIGVLHATARPERPTTYGLAATPHHHAVCARCGELTEIPAGPLADVEARLVEAGSRPDGFRVSGSLLLTGVCAECLSP